MGELCVHKWEWINIESPTYFILLCSLIINLFQIQKLYLLPNSNFVLGLVNNILKDLNYQALNYLCYFNVSILNAYCLVTIEI